MLLDLHVLRMRILCKHDVAHRAQGPGPYRNILFDDYPEACGRQFRFRQMADVRQLFALLLVSNIELLIYFLF